MSKSVLNFLMLVAVFSISPCFSAHALDEFHQSSVGEFDFESTLKYFNATANYTRQGGEYDSLLDGHKYTLADLILDARWVPTARWDFFAQGTYSYATSNDGISDRENGGFSSLVLGADLNLIQFKNIDLLPEAAVTIPFERASASDDKVLIGEGAMEINTRLIAKTHLSFFDPMAFLGFTYRDQGRSALVPYGVGAELSFSNLILGAELRGFQSVTDDKYTDNPLQREIASLKDGGSLKFYSVNPSLLETNFWLRSNSRGQFHFKIGGGSTITGTNTAAGWNVFVTLGYNFREGFSIFKKKSPDTMPSPESSFQEETNDGVDQNLFRLPPPPKPKPKPTPSPELQKKKLQNELDQTEMQIELRSKKKKRKTR